MGDVSLADAIVKGVPGFDRELAYEAIRKDAFEVPPKHVTGVGRECLESYLELGYIPSGADTTTGNSFHNNLIHSPIFLRLIVAWVKLRHEWYITRNELYELFDCLNYQQNAVCDI